MLLVLTACGSRDSFTVEARVDGLGVEALWMVYYADGQLNQSEGRPAEPGDPAKFVGASADYTLVTLRRFNGSDIVGFPARNGDKIKVTVNADGSVAVSGNAACDSLTAFYSRHRSLIESGPSPKLSAAVARFVEANTASVASTVLLTTLFDASASTARADSLYAMIAPEARAPGIVAGWSEQLDLASQDELNRRLGPFTVYSRGDTAMSFVATISPYSLIAFTMTDRADSVASALQRLRADFSDRRLKMLEVTVNTDSAQWARQMANDTARWTRGWVPGGAAAPVVRRMSVTGIPFFIVADSTATQIYRGTSVTAAVNALRSRLK